ncbi:ParB/RepB/Spo0J family partition protein [Scytonema sp. PRP1]|uniref:ParB/RepB/Spo0J family partition protein n=1 Tax=Scytonema sp. PRP1 TaxID=3120513 RepID=UPI00300D48F0
MGKFNKLLTSLQDEELEPQLQNGTKSQEALSQARQFIPRDRIVRDENQVRKYFDVEKLNGLAQTIAEEGILEDLAVYEIPDRSGYYQLVFGERRYRASGIAGLDKVPVRVIEKPDEKKLLKLQLIENKHHEDLNPVEEVEGALALLAAELEKPVETVIALLKQMDNDVRRASYNVIGQPESDVVIKLLEGLNIKWRSFVLNQLPLLGLSSDILEPIRQGKIEYTKALVISRLKDEEQRQEVLQEAITQNLSIRDIRDRIKQLSQSQKATSQPSDYLKRFNAVSRQLKKTDAWENQQKRDRLETLLKEIEDLVK